MMAQNNPTRLTDAIPPQTFDAMFDEATGWLARLVLRRKLYMFGIVVSLLRWLKVSV